MSLALKPGYNHKHVSKPPATVLTWDTALTAYNKLKNYLALEEQSLPPAGGWPKDRPVRHLFHKNGFHHAVSWQPTIKIGWRRLNFQEFLAWYGIAK